MLLSLLLAACVIVAGFGLTYWIPVRLRVEERVAIGAVVGALAFCATTFAMFMVVGMNWATVLVGIAVPALWSIAGLRRAGAAPRAHLASGRARLRLPARRAASLRPFAAVSLAAAVVATRTLSLAYQTTSSGIRVGNLANYGDWSAHLAYAGSFAFGDNRGLDSPLASGTPLRYHFLANYFASPFTVTGASMPQALTLTSWVLAIAFTPLLLCAVRPDIGGVLIRGEKGTAKSTAVRALAAVLPPIDVYEGDRFNIDPADAAATSPDGPFAATAVISMA